MKKDTKKNFDFFVNIKVDNKYINSSVFWNNTFDQLLEYATIFLSTQTQFLHFPELLISHENFMKKLHKSVKFVGYKKQI